MTMPAPHGYHDGNAYNTGAQKGRRLKAAALDHTYYIQADRPFVREVDPLVIPRKPSQWRATCDVCAWVGPWRDGWPEGPKAANGDGADHRAASLGVPGWGHCPDCGTRTPADALCARHAAAYETALTERKDPWSA